MKIFIWVQPKIFHKELHLTEIDKFIINLIKKDFFSSFDIATGTCLDDERDSILLDYNPLIIKLHGEIIDTMTNFLKNRFQPDILIANEKQGKVLSDNLGYPIVILPPKIDLLNKILQKKIWKDVGINIPISILIKSRKAKKSYEYKTKSLIFTDNLEKTIISIIKQEIR